MNYRGHLLGMANMAVACAALLVLALSVSCTDPKSVIPIRPAPVPPTSVTSDPFPGAGTYEFVSSLSGNPVQSATSNSRYTLYGDGTFVLQFGNSEVRGRYTEVDRRIVFNFDFEPRTLGVAGATGVFAGDRMTVTYSVLLVESDYEAAVYLRKP